MTDTDISKSLGLLEGSVNAARDDIAEMKTASIRTETRSISFEKTYIEEHAKLNGVATSAHARIDNHAIKIAEIKTELYELTKNTRTQLLLLTQAVQPLVMTSRVLMWIAGIVGAALTALIIAVITGQVQLVFK